MNALRNRFIVPRSQHGAALMVMLVIMVLGSAAFLVSSLTRIGLSMRNDQINSEALTKAKEALIAYSATQGDLAGTSRPGDLPCPDMNNNGLDDDGNCSAGEVGRLPYITLGIPKLVDSDGETLWYAISGNFRRFSITSNTLNSDTQGTLDVYSNDGSTLLTNSADKAVAVLFAPGRIVGSQQRSSTAQQITASNYLDSYTFPPPISATRNNANTGGPFISADKTDTFNDKLIYIKASQLRPAIEKRAAGEMRKLLQTYYSAWNAFPFAVPFANPSSATYSGTSGTYYGLLPLDALLGGSANQPEWNSTPTVVFSDGTNRLPFCELRDGNWNNSRWRCCKDSSCSTNVTIPAGVSVTITGRLNHVGKGFWEPHNIGNTNEVRVRNSSGNTVLASSVFDPNSVSVVGRLTYSDGSASVVFTGTGKAGGSTLQRIELRDITSYAASFPTWFDANNWERLMYYATSPDYAPGGSHTCTPYCLTYNGQTASAVVVATSATLPNQSRAASPTSVCAATGTNIAPNACQSNYLEGNNASPATATYENRPVSSSFNDTVIRVAP